MNLKSQDLIILAVLAVGAYAWYQQEQEAKPKDKEFVGEADAGASTSTLADAIWGTFNPDLPGKRELGDAVGWNPPTDSTVGDAQQEQEVAKDAAEMIMLEGDWRDSAPVLLPGTPKPSASPGATPSDNYTGNQGGGVVVGGRTRPQPTPAGSKIVDLGDWRAKAPVLYGPGKFLI